jgi:hypothetical protein
MLADGFFEAAFKAIKQVTVPQQWDYYLTGIGLENCHFGSKTIQNPPFLPIHR